MDIISRLPGYAGQAAGRNISLHSGPKWKMHRRHWKFQSQNVQIIGYVYQNTMAKIMVQYGKIQLFLFEREDHDGNGNFRKFNWKTVGKKSQFENNVYSWTEKEKGLFLSVCMRNTHERRWFGRIDIIPRPRFFGLHLQRECEIRNDIVANYRDMLESRISAGSQEKNYLPELQGNLMPKQDLHGSYAMERSCKELRGKYCELCE